MASLSTAQGLAAASVEAARAGSFLYAFGSHGLALERT
jgi:hypothetical protein